MDPRIKHGLITLMNTTQNLTKINYRTWLQLVLITAMTLTTAFYLHAAESGKQPAESKKAAPNHCKHGVDLNSCLTCQGVIKEAEKAAQKAAAEKNLVCKHGVAAYKCEKCNPAPKEQKERPAADKTTRKPVGPLELCPHGVKKTATCYRCSKEGQNKQEQQSAQKQPPESNRK